VPASTGKHSALPPYFVLFSWLVGSVLVVEYGDFANTINTTAPYFATLDQSPRLYDMTSVPQTHLGNRTTRLRIGAVVGGSSKINGMAWDRGSMADYDSWESLGNHGWGWDTMLNYFRKSSTFDPPAPGYVEKYGYQWDSDAYGYGDGPVRVSFPSWQWPESGKREPQCVQFAEDELH
jgi:choline dehydrogenase-like flavoprotein